MSSAAPVGRMLLDLAGEGDGRARAASDALCAALQVLNHLQDCGADFRRLGRVYLPADWLAAEGADVADLAADRAGPALRRVIDRALDATEGLIARARPLPRHLAGARFAAESGAIIAIAERLAARLRRADPLAGRVRLGPPATAWAVLTGISGALLARAAGAGRNPQKE